ncbi:MAG TPA: hypothetical protein VHT24_03255 [Pseudacidobacterium sp.]|nr:hypothetical protein [Pseudacidobacterium sp.]
MTAIQALLDGLIDYAGLFPPAGIDMVTAVRNYASYRSGEYVWALGRFIVPAERLTEFSAAFTDACCDEQMTPWLLSVLSTGDLLKDERLISDFSEGAVFIDVLECKAENSAKAESMFTVMPQEITVYVEFPLEQCKEMLPVLKRANALAKIRTGGISVGAFPDIEQLAHFLVSCAEAKVPFKATAGMHHPLRSVYKLTYETESASTLMHGFINVFVAATIAYYGAKKEDVLAVLSEQDSAAFQWSSHALTWRGRKLSAKQIREARENFATGFGSCSFTEPIDDLQALGWL